MAIINSSNQIKKHYHICICGGGVTGLSLGLELARENPDKNIAIMESGGHSPGAEQTANIGKIIGNDAYPLQISRMRGLSGTQWVWGGNSRPLDPIDFEKREWVENSGWPISYDEVMKYMPQATQALDIDNLDWSREHPELEYPQLRYNSIFEHNHFKLSPQIASRSKAATGTFYQSKKAELESQSNLDIIINHTLVNFTFDSANSKVKSANFLNKELNEMKIDADIIIMAMGCLENSRVLKYICEKNTEINLPGEKNIGRYFMEHPHGALTRNLISKDQIDYYKNSYGKRIGTAVHQARFRVSDFAQKENQLLNVGISTKRSGSGSLADIPNMPPQNVNYSVFLFEQEPMFQNGIIMKNERDMFGIPKIDLKWEISKRTYDNINFIGREFSKILLFNNLARPRIRSFKLGRKIGGGHHHMGTTRMGKTPENAVVDKNCKVFGTENLFIAGSSIFPTSGAVNPTINMLALGFRLAAHLKQEYLS